MGTKDDSNTALVRHSDSGALAVADLSQDQVALIKRTICEGYTDDELALFLHQAERLNLDPLSRQIYTFKAGGKVVIGTTIDGFRKRADGTGCYAPGKKTEFEYEDNKLVSATAFVMKLIPATGEWKETAEDAYFSEFKGSSPTWKTMPRVMLSKCAEARALRRAFPNELGGLYVSEEFDAIRQPGELPPSGAQRRARGFRAAIGKATPPANEGATADAPPPPVEVESEVMATPEERNSVWYAFCELQEWNPDSLPEGAVDHFKEWVAMHCGREAAENTSNWTRAHVETMHAQIRVELAGGEPPEQVDEDGDRIPF